MSSMDLRSRYIRKFGRVPLHLNYKLLDSTVLLQQIGREKKVLKIPFQTTTFKDLFKKCSVKKMFKNI
jgi:hypothetical protein